MVVYVNIGIFKIEPAMVEFEEVYEPPNEHVPEDMVNPLVPLFRPYTLIGEVVPVVPIFAVWPVATVNVLLNVDDVVDKSIYLVPPNEIPIFDAPIL